MSLQRRLLLYLLVCAPLVWAVALFYSIRQARLEVNELFDAQLIHLARQVQATLGSGLVSQKQPLLLPSSRMDSAGADAADAARTSRTPEGAGQASRTGPAGQGGPVGRGDVEADADVHDLALAVWDRQGTLVLFDREGVQLPYHPSRSGFLNEDIRGDAWRIYFLQSFDGRWLVASGQRVYERDELVYGLTISQVVPWLLVLPVLMGVMAWAVRRAFAPMSRITQELQQRPAGELQPLVLERAPTELIPMLDAMNGLFERIEQMVLRERRFTADAAHELRTPLAVLRAQWDVVRRSVNATERRAAEDKLSAGLDRLARLVTQMLALSRVESATTPALSEVSWQPIVEQAMSDCLDLAERRRIELACEWPAAGRHPLPLMGNEHLLTVLLRNLLDNAVRYAPEGSPVTLHVAEDCLEVLNLGPALSTEQVARLGERFYRPEGQQEAGSGLGVSIARRIAELHGLELQFGTLADGTGVRARVGFGTLRRRPGRRAANDPPFPAQR